MTQKIFVVTGGNKGIGYAIVKGLAEEVENGLIYLAARNLKLGKLAQKNIIKELGENRKSEIELFQLEITDESHCQKFAEHLKEQGGIDVLINNAGFAFKKNSTEPPEVQAEITIGINYYGTKLVSKYLTPLIRNGGRVVNVCSRAGLMNNYDQKYIEKFKDVEHLTVKDIDHFVEQYKKFAKEGTRKENGYPESAYRVSKAAEIAFTMLQSRELKSKNIKVNACCPGYVNTDMTSGKGPLTIEEGADTPIYLAIDKNAPDGKFVAERKEINYL